MKHKSVFLFFYFAILLAKTQHGIDPDWYQTIMPVPKANASWNSSGAVANNMIVDRNGRVDR